MIVWQTCSACQGEGGPAHTCSTSASRSVALILLYSLPERAPCAHMRVRTCTLRRLRTAHTNTRQHYPALSAGQCSVPRRQVVLRPRIARGYGHAVQHATAHDRRGARVLRKRAMILSVFTVNIDTVRTLCVLCTTVSALGVLLQRSRRAVANDAACTRCCVPLCLHVDTDTLLGRTGCLTGYDYTRGNRWRSMVLERACMLGGFARHSRRAVAGTLGVL